MAFNIGEGVRELAVGEGNGFFYYCTCSCLVFFFSHPNGPLRDRTVSYPAWTHGRMDEKCGMAKDALGNSAFASRQLSFAGSA